MRPVVALDAMGGDNAPAEIIAGALGAVEHLDVEVLLVGTAELLRSSIGDRMPERGLRIVEAEQSIDMHEHPTEAVRGKPRASMNVAVELVKMGEAQAFVTAGNTGAAMAAALLGLGRIRGIGRPALATIFPTADGAREILLDVGANAEGRPVHLFQFAHMGSAYMQRIYGIGSPRVALLSNGSEESKGNDLVIQTHKLLKDSSLNFIGNVESTDLVRPHADVVVMDGFTGNVLVKTAEAVAELFVGELREVFTRSLPNKAAAFVVRNDLRKMRRRIDYTEVGGAQLLGVNGIVVIGHGRSNARAVFSAVRAAGESVRSGLLEVMTEIGAQMPAKRIEADTEQAPRSPK